MADMGRPIEFDPESIREIRLPHFPKSLYNRFEQMGKDRQEKVVDMVRWIIVKELGVKFVSRPPVQIEKKEKYLNRKFRNISIADWNEFQAKALYYNQPATDILMELIQIEVLRHEKKTQLIKRYCKTFSPELSGTLSFTLKIPKKNLETVTRAAKKKSISVVALVNEAIDQVDNPAFGNIQEFDNNKMKDVIQRRLDAVSRPRWTKFREFCIRKNVNTNRMLVAYINHYIQTA